MDYGLVNKNKMYFLNSFLILGFLSINILASPVIFKKNSNSIHANDSLKWWQETVVYQIYPRSFQDSDGNGVGDLKGIESRLDYLVDLGIGTVWLSPIYKSPMKDFGYDISNFTDVDPTFGTLADFEDLSNAMKTRGLKLILDFIPNHSSDLHEWFLKSIDRIEPYTDFYTWKDGKIENGTRVPPNNWVSVFHGPMWEWNEKRGQYYLHQFAKEQPDLRLENPLVEAHMLAAMKFWLDRGVDGFRMDAVPHMFEDQTFPNEKKDENASPDIPPYEYQYWEHVHTFDLPEVLDSLRLYRILLDIYTVADDHPRVMMTEGYVPEYPDLMKYYGTNDKPIAHFPFNFDLIQIPQNFTSSDIKNRIDGWMNNMPEGQWANWLVGNHDNHRVADRFGKDLIDATNMVVLLLPGTAITYYGEEIGMENTFLTWEETIDPAGCQAGPDRYQLFSRDPERTPMQWSTEKNAGFSNGDNTWLPVNKNYETLNVIAQNNAIESHLKVYKTLTTLRKTDVWKYGSLETRTFEGEVFGFTRILDGKGFMVLMNLRDSDTIVNASSFTYIPLVGIVYARSVGFADNTIVIGTPIPTVAIKLPARSSLVLTL